MILVKRPSVPQKLKTLAKQELKDILRHFEARRRKGGFSFKAYKADGVAHALNDMFHGKCAYCESPMRAVQPTDIEHYRPKSAIRVGNRKIKPGYYWLAAKWENLLPSCIYCNRPNRQDLPHGTRETQGKGIDFPLYDERRRARHSSHNLRAERPLILNPCGRIDPRDHLDFTDDGDVWPKAAADGRPSRYGEETIRILALRRPGLITDRRERAIRVLGELSLAEELSERAESNDVALRQQGERLKAIARFLEPTEPYLALTRDLIDREQPGLLTKLPRIIRELDRLLPARPKRRRRVLALDLPAQIAQHRHHQAGQSGGAPSTAP
jgi:uncharacterized protein (TIGR02646 family)